MSAEIYKPKTNIEALHDWYQRNIDSLESKLKLESNELKRQVIIYNICSWKFLKEGIIFNEP